MIRKIFYGIVNHGKIIRDDEKNYRILLCTLEGKRIGETIEKEHKQRSNQQNRYYFGVVVPIIAECLGYSINETHEGLKDMFLCDRTGKLPRIKSTTELSTVDWESYMSQVRQWASQFLVVYVPDPGEGDF